MKFDITIMMHPSREKYRDYLFSKLGKVPVVMDRGMGLWDTARRAWLNFDKTKQFHLVIQDDAIIGDRMIERLNRELCDEKFAYNLYLGRRSRDAKYTKELHDSVKVGHYLKEKLSWGVGICLPTKLIPEMIKYCDGMDRFKNNDDTKISVFLKTKGMKTWYIMPSLINHRDDINSLIERDRHYHRIAECFIDDYIIPRTIHQIWMGDKKRPEQWMNSWKEKHPAWNYKIWNEEMIRALSLQNIEIFDKYKSMGKWYGMADVARAEIIYREGGVYIDADCECLESMDFAKFLDRKIFLTLANPNQDMPGRISNSVFGARKEHPFFKLYIDRIGQAKEINPPWNTIGGTLLTDCVNEFGQNKIELLPPHYFYPENSRGTIKYSGQDKIYGRHYWGSTKNLY